MSLICGKLDPTTSRGRTSLTPNELNIELSCFPFRFDLESSLERNVITYFYIRRCLIAYSFVHLVPRPGKDSSRTLKNLDLNQLRIRVACLICLITRGNPGMAEKKKVKNLIKFRDSHQNFVRKTIAEAKELMSGGNPIEVRKLKLLRTSLQTKCSELQVLDRDIVELLEDVSKIDSDVSESCELISGIQECMVDLESALTAQESQGKIQQSNSLESAGTAQGHLQTIHTHAKLPKLELKKFHRNPIEWYPFWESLESAVLKNSNLSGVDKFNYLKSLLTSIAQSVVTGLALTSANYEKAVELLKRRFGDRQVVISSHMEALTKIPKVASTSEIKRLPSLYDTVESHVRGLESMEISSEMYGCFLTPIIMQKLPEEFRIAISRKLESETWDLKKILSEFHKELQLREQCLVNPKDVRPSNSFQRGESLQSTSAL